MIPTMLIAGFLVGFLPGRWALTAVAALGIVWAAGGLANGIVSGLGGALCAALIGWANVAVGAAVPQIARRVVTPRL